ncbi:MAG: hypothetical protein LBL76_07910 [Treponema sp.]|jgi:hypothetical protein|nr:hypothetical protein [Treponema sp.]
MIEVTLTNNLSSIDLQIHFCFKDTDVHAMNADIFNNCQRQFINALKKANKFLDEPLLIEVTARKEGGLIDIIRIIFKHPIASIVITALISSFFSAQFRQKLPITEETKNKIENIVSIKEAINSGTITEDEFKYITSNDTELKKLKSNFFKSAKKDNTLTQVEIETPTEINDKPIFNKITIPYNKFDDFILVDDPEDEDPDTEKDDKARIFIIAPVLVEGVHTYWKGYYRGSPIVFKVTDKDFLNDIYLHGTKFGNGTYIDCKLVSTIVIKSSTGKENITREVIYVEEIGDDKNFKKPIKHKKNNFDDTDQGNLFPD